MNLEEINLKGVKKNGLLIQEIKDPSEAVQLAVVEQNGYAIKFIETPLLDVQLAAIKQNGFAIKFIKDPPEYVQLAAVQENIECVKYMDKSIIVKRLKGLNIDDKEIENFFMLIKNKDYTLVPLLF